MHVQLQYLELIYLVYKGYWVYSLIIVLFTCANTISLLRTLLAHETKMITLMNRPRLVPMVMGGWVRAAGSHRSDPHLHSSIPPTKLSLHQSFICLSLRGFCQIVIHAFCDHACKAYTCFMRVLSVPYLISSDQIRSFVVSISVHVFMLCSVI